MSRSWLGTRWQGKSWLMLSHLRAARRELLIHFVLLPTILWSGRGWFRFPDFRFYLSHNGEIHLFLYYCCNFLTSWPGVKKKERSWCESVVLLMSWYWVAPQAAYLSVPCWLCCHLFPVMDFLSNQFEHSQKTPGHRWLFSLKFTGNLVKL